MSAHYIFISTAIVLTGFCIYRIQRFLRIHRTWELAFLLIFFTMGTTVVIQNEFISPKVEFVFFISLSFFILLLAAEPEIANFFNKLIERFNPNSLRRKKVALNEIAQAAAALAATKTGALIAFERNDSLLKFGETGIEINADIKRELLLTLFYKDTPTHDGGLLIREGRVTHCGVVFPLSDRKQIEDGLGTRHRAALGISEKTDAVCLVVSEEEGTISFSRDGELFYAIPPKQVEAKLTKLLSRSSHFRFYPFHYIKHLSPKLVQSNYICFTKSMSEKIYEMIVVAFFSALFYLLSLHHIINLEDYRAPLDLLLSRPWLYAPLLLLAFNLIILLSGQNVSVNGVMNEIIIEHRFLFIPVWKKMMLRENLKGVSLKHEKTGNNLWSLLLFNKKRRRNYLLDRSTSAKSLIEYAKKIKDVLKIDLVN